MDIFGDRFKLYEDNYDFQLMRRVPVIIRCDGKNFSRLTRKVEKPFDSILTDCMINTMFESIKEMEGALFGYQQSDEITFVLRNDQSNESLPWFKNRIQKIISTAASLATYSFNNYLNSLNIKPNLVGCALFDARVFTVPNNVEVLNNLIWRQQDCLRNAVASAAQTELKKKFGRKTALELLEKRNVKERIQLLKTECQIDFETKYPTSFRRGAAVYKVPTVSGPDATSRYKWVVSKEIPIFADDRNFIMNILNSGHDIFRLKNIT